MTVTAKCLVNSKFAANTSTTEYTTPGSTKTIIDKFTATNTDSSAQTITVHIVPSGGSVADSYMIVKEHSISAGTTYDISEMQNQILNAGEFISCWASLGSKVVIRVSGREVT